MRVVPAECAEGRDDDSSQAEGAWLFVLSQEDGNAAFNFLQLFLTGYYGGALGLQSLSLKYHTLVGVSHLVLQSQLHTGQELAGGGRRLWGQQHLISAAGQGSKGQL